VRGGRPPVRWIVSPGYDLTFFIGSCALTFVFYGIWMAAQRMGVAPGMDSVLLTYFVFTALLDHPHIFQTFARTHADRGEFDRHRWLHTTGLVLFVLAGFVIMAVGGEAWLIVGAAVIGTWHIIRQHWGFLKIYKGLNNDRAPLDNWLDGLTYFTGMFACFFQDWGGLRGPIVVYGSIKVNAPSLPAGWGEAVWSLFLVLLVVFGFRQVQRAALGLPVNIPKLLLMGSALTTHWFVFFATATPFLVAEALETAYHDVQYQGWMMRFQKIRFPQVRRVALKWGLAALGYGLLVGTVEVLGLMRPGSWAMWCFVPFTMVVLWHYVVDGVIWRMRVDPSLRDMLAAPPAKD